MIKGELLGGSELLARIQALTPNLRQGLGRTVLRLTILLQAKVKTKLTGQVLNVRTGRLRRSINHRIEGEGTPVVTGYVGTNVKYARPHEFGFHGRVTVKQHLRMQVTAWGRPMLEPRQVTVRAHTAMRDLPERSFLRSSIIEMEPTIRAEFQKLVEGKK